MVKDYSQHGEYPVLAKLAKELNVPKLIVDIGASDGITDSNSRGFLERGWKGILIEPDPRKFIKLYQNNRKFNNELYNVAISNYNGKAILNLNLYGGSSSLTSIREREGKWSTLVFHLWNVINVNSDIGILDIDTEGEEYNILFDIFSQRMFPKIIVTEGNNKDLRQKQALLLKQNKYKFISQLNVNTIWVHEI